MSSLVPVMENVKILMQRRGKWEEKMEEEIPRKFEKHGNSIIFPKDSFKHSCWDEVEFWKGIAEGMKVEKLFRRTGGTKLDKFRTPDVELLYGEDEWILKKENGIWFSWNAAKCMFSSGNITEKQRISRWNCTESVVVDLFAGIGYFTLSYLVHAKAAYVYACEWNHAAVEALRKNLEMNKVAERCEVLEGDNNETCPSGVADHVNLGLLPTARCSWRTACKALKKTGGMLHIHENVDIPLDETVQEAYKRWKNEVSSDLREIFKSLYSGQEWIIEPMELVKVKSYAPRVDHVVLDLMCKPNQLLNKAEND